MMAKFVAIGLLVLLALAGLPLSMDGGAMMACPSCPSGYSPAMFSICLAVLAMLLVFSLEILGRITSSPAKHSAVLVATGLFKPPRTI